MKAAELREALEAQDALERVVPGGPRHAKTIIDAARNIALPILEADPELVERVRLAIDSRWRYRQSLTVEAIAHIETAANRVLAAISTPPPGQK